MLKKYFSILSIFFALMFIVSCSDDSSTEPTINESEVLAQYIESTTDFINSSYHPGTIAAADVKTLVTTGKAYVIDLRAPSDFAKGRIPGAINLALKDLITHVKNMKSTGDYDKYDKIVLVCYSGQNALYGGAFLRFMGYDKVVSLAFGMASWHSDFGAGSWPDKISNAYATQIVKTESPAKNPIGQMPVLNTGKKEGKEILEARVDAVIAEGFSPIATITAQQVFENPSNYYILSYWPSNHYLDPGHIPTSINYIPKNDLKLSTFLKTLPTDKTIVVYCYTGNGSAVITAYLRLLGYNAKSLLYGANGFIYDLINGKPGFTTWKPTSCMNYEYEK